MKTLDVSRPRPESNGQIINLMKQETMNIIRHKTNYGNFAKQVDRANSFV